MNNRFKFRVWDIEEWTYLKCKYSKSAGYHKYTFGKHNVWQDIGYFIESNPKYYIVEQCTGLKDKNGNLIYEGDILDCELQDIDSHGYPFIHFKKGVVKRAKNGAYCVEGDDDFYASDITLYPIEIIGNIHEQAEQKDVK